MNHLFFIPFHSRAVYRRFTARFTAGLPPICRRFTAARNHYLFIPFHSLSFRTAGSPPGLPPAERKTYHAFFTPRTKHHSLFMPFLPYRRFTAGLPTCDQTSSIFFPFQAYKIIPFSFQVQNISSFSFRAAGLPPGLPPAERKHNHTLFIPDTKNHSLFIPFHSVPPVYLWFAASLPALYRLGRRIPGQRRHLSNFNGGLKPS